MISPRLPSYTYLLLFSHERGAVEPTKLSGAPYLLQPLDPKCRKAQSNLSGSPHVNALVRNSDGIQLPRDRNETEGNLNSFVDCRRREIVPLLSSPTNAQRTLRLRAQKTHPSSVTNITTVSTISSRRQNSSIERHRAVFANDSPPVDDPSFVAPTFHTQKHCL